SDIPHEILEDAHHVIIVTTSTLLDYDTAVPPCGNAASSAPSLWEEFRPDSLVIKLDGSFVVDVAGLDRNHS
ncbi:hypothetical protein FRC00_013171, partial [Tulasnella sp. 408]